MEPTPTQDGLPRRMADFPTMVEAVEYAAQGARGANFYSARGELVSVLTYRDLRDLAREVGRRLAALGYAPGDRIALIAATDPAFLVYFIGCQYASVLPVPLPLPTSFGGREGYVAQLHTQMESCRATAVIGPGSMAEFIADAAQGLPVRFAGTFEEFDALSAEGGELRLPTSGDLAYLQY
ncbi:MAG: fatty acyl-AMP ligase, partial [Alphaproteobacteria bacterium]